MNSCSNQRPTSHDSMVLYMGAKSGPRIAYIPGLTSADWVFLLRGTLLRRNSAPRSTAKHSRELLRDERRPRWQLTDSTPSKDPAKWPLRRTSLDVRKKSMAQFGAAHRHGGRRRRTRNADRRGSNATERRIRTVQGYTRVGS